MNRGGSERGRHRVWNGLQALSCQHRARRRAQTHGPWDHDLSRSRPPNQLSHPGAPNMYSFLRDSKRQSEWGRGRESGRHRIWSRLQALSCQHRVWRGARTHGPWDHDLSRSQTPNRLSHPGAPISGIFKKYYMKSITDESITLENVATLAFLWLVLSWCIFFHLSIFF